MNTYEKDGGQVFSAGGCHSLSVLDIASLHIYAQFFTRAVGLDGLEPTVLEEQLTTAADMAVKAAEIWVRESQKRQKQMGYES